VKKEMIMASAVELTNARAGVPMDIPDGRGNILHLEPKETRVVYGEVAYFRRMMSQGVTGLVVKAATGKKALAAESEADVDMAVDDVRLVTITNHRQIPMDLATGVDRMTIHIEPGQTSAPVTARVSLIKQVTGVSVHKVEGTPAPVHAGTAKPGSKKARGHKAGPGLKVEAEQGVPHTSEPPVESIAELRSRLQLPDTLPEFEQRLQRVVWHDLRGMARQVGVKGKTRDEIVVALKAKLYPKG
jgi:hypothetical protein